MKLSLGAIPSAAGAVRRMMIVSGALILVAITQACGMDTGSGEGSGVLPTGDPHIVSVDLQPVDETGEALSQVDPETLDDTVAILRSRVKGLGAEGGKVSRQGNTITVQLPGATDQQDVIDLVGTTARLRFRPVLAVLDGQLDTKLTPREDITVDQEVTLADSEGRVYQLGPTFTSGDRTLEGEAVEDATAGLNQQGEWVVNPSFRGGEDGIDLFNAAASACYNGEPTCPAQQGGRGQLAIVLDGEVLTAPSINEATFARDQIQISGSFDQESAQAVAVALRYGSLPVDLAPR